MGGYNPAEFLKFACQFRAIAHRSEFIGRRKFGVVIALRVAEALSTTLLFVHRMLWNTVLTASTVNKWSRSSAVLTPCA